MGGVRPPASPRPRAPRPPPTAEQVQALAGRERVPARIAKGELEGKMKCRVWKRLHAEEAKRFDQAYTLMGQYPELSLEDAFGLIQSERSIDQFRAKRQVGERRAEVKRARGEVPSEGVDAWIQELLEARVEVSVVLGDRTLIDVLEGVSPSAFTFQRQGRLEKLKVVLLARRESWERLLPTLERDAKLAQKPAPIIREPDRRPVSDPRPFLALRGIPTRVTLRNGLRLGLPVAEVGPFDLVLGRAAHTLLVPFHAMVDADAEETL
ncbi:MAG TPA: hypothetical protein VEY30_12260 [Myxococcaceae bacterium]|nr:hypothetical protein [Myxococcaceae bacterium]